MKIETLEDLRDAAWDKKAVIIPKGNCWSRRHFPAAFMIQQNGWLLLKLFNIGMFIYEPKRKRRNRN